MRNLFIAAASALFFAYIVTELSARVWPDNNLALLIIAFVALFLAGLLNLKLAGLLTTRSATSARAAAAQPVQARHADQRARERAPRRGSRQETPHNNGDRAGQRARGPAPAGGEPGTRESGTVKWFNRTKGFGFVIRENGEEIFVHQRSIRAIGEGDERRRPALRDGQAVSFYVATREKGLQAEDVFPTED
jgi:cold shock CspA family protein